MASDSPPSARRTNLESLEFYRVRYFVPLLLSLIAVRAVTSLAYGVALVPFKPDITFPEGAIVYGAGRVAAGQSPYTDWREWPHYFAPYGPLLYYPVGIIARMFGSGATHDLIYKIGRIQSVASLLGIAMAVVFISGRLSITRFAQWLPAGLLFVCSDEIIQFAVTYRPDSPQVFFSMAALAVVLSGSPTRARALTAYTLLFIAFWFKPTSWGMALALGYWVGAAHGRRAGMLAIFAFAAAGLLLFALINWMMEGRLWLNMVVSMDNGMYPNAILVFWGMFRWAFILTFLIAAATAIMIFRGRASATPVQKAIAAAWSCSHLATFIQCQKVGADSNYLLEPFTLSAVMAVLGITTAFSIQNTNARWARETIFLVVILPVMTYQCGAGIVTFRRDMKTVVSHWEHYAFAKKIASKGGPILARESYWPLIGSTIPTIMDPRHYGLLVQRGRLDDSEIIQRVERRAFPAIIFGKSDFDPVGPNYRLFSPRFAESLRRNYHITDAYEEWRMWEPLPAEPTH